MAVKRNNIENDNIFKKIVHGRVFDSDALRRHMGQLICILALVLINRMQFYNYQSKERDINQLKTELNKAKSNCVRASAAYNSLIRESEMQQLVDSLHSGLTVADRPPFPLENSNS